MRRGQDEDREKTGYRRSHYGGVNGQHHGVRNLEKRFLFPTVQEVADAADFVANADALVGFMNTLAPSRPVSAVIAALKVAKAVFDQIKSGICASPDQQQAAKAAIQAQPRRWL